MRISDWSSDVCSSDLLGPFGQGEVAAQTGALHVAALPRSVAAGPQGSGDCRKRIMALSCRPLPRVRGDLGGGGLDPDLRARTVVQQIGRASCRESVCQYVYISGVAGSLKQKTQ